MIFRLNERKIDPLWWAMKKADKVSRFDIERKEVMSWILVEEIQGMGGDKEAKMELKF